jgi:hypothetical protein
MRIAIISVMILSGGLFASSALHADDRGPTLEIPLPIPHVSDDRVHDDRDMDRRSPGCETTTVYRENDQGESKTVETRHCD